MVIATMYCSVGSIRAQGMRRSASSSNSVKKSPLCRPILTSARSRMTTPPGIKSSSSKAVVAAPLDVPSMAAPSRLSTAIGSAGFLSPSRTTSSRAGGISCAGSSGNWTVFPLSLALSTLVLSADLSRCAVGRDPFEVLDVFVGDFLNSRPAGALPFSPGVMRTSFSSSEMSGRVESAADEPFISGEECGLGSTECVRAGCEGGSRLA